MSKLNGTMGAHRGLDRDSLVWSYGTVDLYVFPRGGIMSARHRSDILEPIVRPHACAIGNSFTLMQDNARATQLRCQLPSSMTQVSV